MTRKRKKNLNCFRGW